MHCKPKTMIKTAVALGAVLVATYLAVPEARGFVAASAPIQLALICPITMIAMLFMMNGTAGKGRGVGSAEPQSNANRPAPEPHPDPSARPSA